LKPILDQWTIVIVGSWNLAILHPEWVGNQLLELPEVEVEMVVGPIRPQYRISSPALTIIPRAGQVIFNPRQNTPEALAAAEHAATNLLDKLGRTPVNAVGINFGYQEEAPSVQLADLFAIGDTARISDVPLSIKSTSITRQLDYEGGDLNLRMTLNDGKVDFHFNYNRSGATTAQLKEAIFGKVAPYRAHSQALLASLYEIEETEQENALG
jgi:hypothetical protein